MDTSDPRCWHRRGDHSAARESGKQECRHPESLLLGRVRSGRVSKRGAHPWRGRNGGHARREGKPHRSHCTSRRREILDRFVLEEDKARVAGNRRSRCRGSRSSLRGRSSGARPPFFAGGRNGVTSDHSRSVKSLGYPAVFQAMLNASGASPGHTILRSSGRSQRITTR